MDVDAQIRAGRALLDTLHLKESEPIVGTNDPIVSPQTGTIKFGMYVASTAYFSMSMSATALCTQLIVSTPTGFPREPSMTPLLLPST